jgi:hypothetical protein
VCEILFLAVKEEAGLRMSDMSSLRRILGSKVKEGAGGWEKQHNEDLRKLYPVSYFIRVMNSVKMRCPRHVTYIRMWKCIQNV